MDGTTILPYNTYKQIEIQEERRIKKQIVRSSEDTQYGFGQQRSKSDPVFIIRQNRKKPYENVFDRTIRK